MGTWSGEERRREPRLSARLRVTFLLAGREHIAYTEDVSPQGLRLRTDAALPERQLLRLRIALEDAGAESDCQAMVVHAGPSSLDGAPTVGFRFYALADALRQTWQARLATLPQAPTPTPAPTPTSMSAEEPVEELLELEELPPDEPDAPSDDQDSDSRRQWPRRRARITVYIGSMEDLITFTSTNVSRGGMFLATTVAFAIGDRLRLEMRSPDTNPFFVDAVVRRHDPSGDPPGIAVEFVSEADGVKIDEMLEDMIAEDPVTGSSEPPVFVTSFDPNLE